MNKILTLLVIVLATTACFQEHDGKKRSTGTTNEILVVTNTKADWEGEIGDTLRAFFGQAMVGVPQLEPTFTFLNVASKDFNNIYKKMHNIFIVAMDPTIPEPFVETKKDLWSAPQRVIKMNVPDKESLNALFSAQKETYMELFTELERERIINNFKMAQDLGISRTLVNDFGLYLEVPGGFKISTKSEDHIWMRHTVQKMKQDVELGILIYRVPYTDTLMFDPEQIILRRNRITQEQVKGKLKGSFMKVADDHIPPVFRHADDLPVDYVIETRGLWDMANDFMGGPFLSYTFVDEKSGMMYTLDGYIYYPNEMKRNYLRELEAIFHTLEISGASPS